MKKSMVRLCFSLICLGIINLASSQTIQQNSSTVGLVGSLEFGPVLWKSTDLEVFDYASTLGIRGKLNYGINELFSVGLAYLQSFRFAQYEDEDFKINLFQFEGRMHFAGTDSKFRPTLAVNLTYSGGNPELFTDSGSTAISNLRGFGLGLEGGLKYFVNPTLALNAVLNYTTGRYTNNITDGMADTDTFDFSIIFLGLGVSYRLALN